MIVDQMLSEIRASYLHDISLSTDPVFINQKIKQRYTDEIVNIIIKGDRSEEKEALRIELDHRIQSLKVSSNRSSIDINILQYLMDHDL